MRRLGQVLYGLLLMGVSFLVPLYTPTCHNEHLLTLERWAAAHPPYIDTQTTAPLPLLIGEYLLFQYGLPWVSWGKLLRGLAVMSIFLGAPLRGSTALRISYYGWALLGVVTPFSHERQTFFLWFAGLSLPIPAFTCGLLWGIIGALYPMATLFLPFTLYKTPKRISYLQGFVLGIMSSLALVYQTNLQTFYGQVYLPLMLPNEIFSVGVVFVLSGIGYIFILRRQTNLRIADREALQEAWITLNLLYAALGGLWGLIAAGLYTTPRVPFLDKWNSRFVLGILGIGSLAWGITLRDLPPKRISLPAKTLVLEGDQAYIQSAPQCAQKISPRIWILYLKKSYWREIYKQWEPPYYIWDPKGYFSLLRYYLPSLTESYNPTQEGWISADNHTPIGNTPSVSENSADQK